MSETSSGAASRAAHLLKEAADVLLPVMAGRSAACSAHAKRLLVLVYQAERDALALKEMGGDHVA